MKSLFDDKWDKEWKQHWEDMPEFEQENQLPKRTLLVHFDSPEAVAAFSKLVNQTITNKTKSIWYPKAEVWHFMDKRYKGTTSAE